MLWPRNQLQGQDFTLWQLRNVFRKVLMFVGDPKPTITAIIMITARVQLTIIMMMVRIILFNNSALIIIIIIIKHIYYSVLTSKAIRRRCTIKPFMPTNINKIL